MLYKAWIKGDSTFLIHNWFGSAFNKNYIILQMQESDSSSSESLASLQEKQKAICKSNPKKLKIII